MTDKDCEMAIGMAETLLKDASDLKNPNRSLIYNSILDRYSGFINISNISINYVVMATNRIINSNVVDKRVNENVEHFKTTGKLLDFGTALLIVIRDHKDDRFLVADGQHRLSTLNRLKEMKLTEDLFISVDIKMVNTEEEARDYLMLFQVQYAPDNRLFSANMVERTKKQNLIDLFRGLWPSAFHLHDNREVKKANNRVSSNFRMEVERPNLSDGIVCDLFMDISVLRSDNITSEKLIQINEYIKTLYDASSRSIDGCYFGKLREDHKNIRNVNNKFQ